MREVSCTLKKKRLDYHLRLGLSFAGSGEIKRREVVLDPQVCPARSRAGSGAGLRKLDYPLLQFPNSCTTDMVFYDYAPAQELKQQLAEYTSRFALAKSHCQLCDIVVVLVVVHASSGGGPRPLLVVVRGLFWRWSMALFWWWSTASSGGGPRPLLVVVHGLFWWWSTALRFFEGSDCADEPLAVSPTTRPLPFARP